jgi:hypothetical protein
MKKKEYRITNIYQLGIRFTKPGLYCVMSDTKEFNEYRFYDGKWIENWPEGVEFDVDGGPEDDIILGGLHWWLISDHMRKVLINSNITGIQFLPVKVTHAGLNEEIGPYWAINVIRNVDELTWSSIDDLDFFRRSTGIFVSNRLKRRLEQQGANRGVSFTRMPMELIDPSGSETRSRK